MAAKGRKPQRFVVPEITEGMCARCRFWALVDDEGRGVCARLAVVFQRERGRVKRRIPDRDTLWLGPLERDLNERTIRATDGWEWREVPEKRIEASEDWADVPRFYFDDKGEKHKVWEPLGTHEWMACSRYERKERNAA